MLAEDTPCFLPRKGKILMKKMIKSKLFAVPFLFSVTFFMFMAIILMVERQLSYSIKWQTAAEFSAVIAALMVLMRFKGGKKREFENIEHGSTRWGKQNDIKPYIDPVFEKNIILSSKEFLSMNIYKTNLNCHVLVFGGSGSGKSRFYALPNIMQMNASYVITDPSGEHLRNEGKMLEEHGYKVKVFNIVDMENSLHFNPFHYYREPEDIIRFVELFIANTSGGKAQSTSDDMGFWQNCEKLWFMAHIAYIQETCMEDEKNMKSLVLLLDNSVTKEEDEDFKSPVDILFDELEQQNPESFAVKQYKKYKLAAGKTAKSILISVGVRLANFDIPKVANLFDDDELELEKMGDEKTALFIIVSDTDKTFNYLVAILLDVLFKTLSKAADNSPKGHLKIQVRCILDEIANIGFFPDLHILIAVLRKRWVSLELLFQNVSQGKALYKDNWPTIESNCDSTVFLGNKGEDTTKYVSNVMLGKATIDTVSYGGGGTANSFGNNSYNSNEQKAGRNLLDEAEVARLDKTECIVQLRGLQPFKSKKYDPKDHKNYRFLANGDPDNTYRFHRGLDLQKSEIQYITIDLNSQEEI